MATCPFCGGFRSDERECNCLGTYYAEKRAGRIPPGLPPDAFEYSVWRKIRGVEQKLQTDPNFTEEQAQRGLAMIVEEANAHYQYTQRRIAEMEAEKARLANTPRKRLY